MNAEDAPTGGASDIFAAAKQHRDSTAQARAEALAFDLSALAAGVWLPTPEILDALAAVGWAVAFDMHVGEMAAV